MRKKMKNVLRNLSLFLVFFTSVSAFAQTHSITGKVTDPKGEAIPGVNVVVKGTTVGTVTSFNGEYQLAVSLDEAEVLVFSFIGFNTQEVEISGKREISVVLIEDTELLEDVVVVGYGQQKKESVVGSIVSAKGEQLLQAGHTTTISESLAGLLPGVTVMQNAGQPGATEANILIRGVSSWQNNAPLYIVDGVERDFNNLDPNEIETISVLKDASATAVFGLKAANGVILITTKRGVAGKPTITFSSNWGVKVPTVEYNYEMDYSKILEHNNVAALNDYNYSSMWRQSYIDTWADPNRDPDFYTYTFYPDYMIDNGQSRQYNLNVSGGNEKVKYFTSFGYNYDGDIFDIKKQEEFDPRTYQKRYNWRSNLDFQLTKSTKLAVNLSGDFIDWNGNVVSDANKTGVGSEVEPGRGQHFNGLFEGTQVGPPLVYSDGRLGIEGGTSARETTYGKMQYTGNYHNRSTRIYSDFVLEQQISDNLKFAGKVSLNYYRKYQSTIWVSKVLYFYPDYQDMVIRQHQNEDDYAGLPTYGAESLDGYNKDLYYDMRLTYDKTFNDTHTLHLMGLFQRREKIGEVNFPKREEGWVARATYGYKNKYLLEFNGAYNGNENWALGMKFGFFPSGAIGWVVSEEDFVKSKMPFIEFFKIKYSYGIVGSSAYIKNESQRFSYRQIYNQGQSVRYGNGAQKTNYGDLYAEGIPANPNSTWEESTKQNLGFELTFLQGRLNTDIDLFAEKRTGILMQRKNTIPPWYGNDAPIANIGETKNHGFDVNVKWNGEIGTNFTYWLNGQFSISENRIVKRDDALNTLEYRKQAGKPINTIYGQLVEGYLNSWDDIYNTTTPNSNENSMRPGDFRFRDYNADGIIDHNDNVPIGYPAYASSSYAFSLGVAYKNLSLYGMFNGVFNISKSISDRYLWNENDVLTPDEKDYWTPENMNASAPRPTLIPNYNTGRSTYSIRNSDFLRLRSLELKYTFSKPVLQRIRYIDGLEIYVNGNNLFVWSDLPKAFDPEAKELEAYPITKRYNIGFRVSF